MTTKEARHYLNQIGRIKIQILQWQKRQEELRARAFSTGGMPAGERVQTSATGDALVNKVAKYVDMERDIEKMILDLEERKNAITKQIHRIDDSRYVQILFKRYVELKRFELISVEMGYEYKWTCRLHGQALEAFAKEHEQTRRGLW